MKYVVIGTGNISRTYVNAINEMENSEIVACLSRSGKTPESLPNIPCWPDLKSVSVDFDAVIVSTPNGLHYEGVIAAAEAGKHVITEKPLGINNEEVDRALVACKAAGVSLAVCFQHRSSPNNQTLKKLIEEGKLGRIFAADLSAKFYRGQDYYDSAEYRGGYAIDGGGPFMQQACHNLDIYAWFFGLPHKIVSAMGTFTHDIETEDHGAALLQYENGMIGTVVASTSTLPGFAARLEVHSDLGSFTLTDDLITEWNFESIPNPSDPDFEYNHDGATSASVSDFSAHRAMLLDFEASIREGRAPLASGESAKQTTQFITSIYRAAKN